MHIVLGVTGGVAAYKSASLARLLVKQGHDVQVVMTPGAKHFIQPLTFQALTGRRVRDSLWDDGAEASMGHIELARWADVILIAPATAQFLAGLANGFAHDLLSTLCLASKARIIVAPAMNEKMWLSVPVSHNVELLLERGVLFLGPDSGPQACGDSGFGRMLEPADIAEHFITDSRPLSGVRILLTAGPTREFLDPIRFMSNRSSGQMGFCLASAAVALGAEVTLISGPVTLPTPINVNRIDVVSAVEMYHAVHEHVEHHDWFISTAAVADYSCAELSDQKIKKSSATLKLELIANPDILLSVAGLKSRPLLIGFAAETESLLTRAEEKRKRKRCEFMIANNVGSGKVMGQKTSKASLLSSCGVKHYPELPKSTLARMVLLDIHHRVEILANASVSSSSDDLPLSG